MLTAIKERGVEAIGLTDLDTAISEVYPETPLQRCTTRLKRNVMNKVRHGDKSEMAEDLRRIFRPGTRAIRWRLHGKTGTCFWTNGARTTGASGT